MEPFEIMVSESQERMLCVVEPANVGAVLELCEKWEVGGAPIGTVTDTGQMRVFKAGELVGGMPVRALVDDCPLYDLEPVKRRPARHTQRRRRSLSQEDTADGDRCSRCCPRRTSPRAGRCSSSTTRWCSRARCAAPSRPTRRCSRPRSTAGAPGGRAIDCNGRRVAADPYTGTVAAVLECAVEPRVRGRRAARHDQQPQLRQPREAAHRLAADRGGARPRRRLPGAAGADRGRQRVAL